MMPTAIRIPETISAFERLLAACVLFYGAVLFCLPVRVFDGMVFPWWATKISIGNVLLHELIFLVWVTLYGARFVLRPLLNGGIPTRQAALWLIALALWCGLISIVAPLPFQDIGRTFRLLVNAALLFAVVRWTKQAGNFPLGMLILGFFTGAIINLVISFQNPFIVNDAMRLSGQNTPGVAMGIAIHLSAWLFFFTSHRTVQAFAVIATLVFVFGCGISYSRIGWFAGALGLIAWAYILIAARPRERAEKLRLRKTRWVWVPLLAISLVVFQTTSLAQKNLQLIQTLVEQKISQTSTFEGSNLQRAYYFIGVAQILMKHPLGVGYSGFFDAMMVTDAYRSGKSAIEVGYSANPHSAFLYYASAGGIPGAVMVIAVFIMMLNSMRFGLISALGRPGMAFFALAAPVFLLIGFTLPYLLNSIILIVPTAITAGLGWSLQEKRVLSISSNTR